MLNLSGEWYFEVHFSNYSPSTTPNEGIGITEWLLNHTLLIWVEVVIINFLTISLLNAYYKMMESFFIFFS